MANQQENIIHLMMEPSTIGEALEDYFRKYEIISENQRIHELHVPIGTDDEGNVPVSATLIDVEMDLSRYPSDSLGSVN